MINPDTFDKISEILMHAKGYDIENRVSNYIKWDLMRKGVNAFERRTTVDGFGRDLKEVLHLFEGHYTVYSSDSIHSIELYEIDPDTNALTMYIGASLRGEDQLSVNIVGEVDIVERLIAMVKEKYTKEKTIVFTSVTGVSDHGIARGNTTVSKVSELDFGNDDFYPFIEGGIEDNVKAFMESSASVLFLIGSPGTGKSTFSRTLFNLADRPRNLIVDNEFVTSSPDFSKVLSSLSSKEIMLIEDADNLMAKREDHNKTMVSLLNASSGVVPSEAKIIISTNMSSINKVDPALLRPGRTHDIIEFRELTAEEARKARESIGLEPWEFSESETYTLSEALHDNPGQATKVKSMQRVGF